MVKIMKSMFYLACLFTCSDVCAAKVGLCITATGKYISFVDPLIASAEKYFCQAHDVTYFIFTDSLRESTHNTIYLSHSKLGWPLDTLKRYHAYFAYRDFLKTQDYLFALDADMLFVDKVGDEILGERVATIHPGYFQNTRNYFPYDRNSSSKACVHSHEGAAYYAGGFYGGATEEFLKILKTITANIDDDLSRGIIAEWHDESHWNRYCIDHEPTVVLSPSYCFAENMPHLPFPMKLMALVKNHHEYRSD